MRKHILLALFLGLVLLAAGSLAEGKIKVPLAVIRLKIQKGEVALYSSRRSF